MDSGYASFKDFRAIYRNAGPYHLRATGFKAWFLEDNYRAIADAARGARRVLDLACGEGCLASYLQDVELVGVDYSTDALRLADSHFPGRYGQLLQGDLRQIDRLALPPGSFDAVVCSLSFMYLVPDDLPACLAHVHQLLAPDGWLIATYPTVSQRRRPSPEAAELTPDALSATLSASGFSVVRLTPFCPLIGADVVAASDSADAATVVAARQQYQDARRQMTLDSSYHFLCVARRTAHDR
jgi:SAM-dependent methyltransferase